MGVRLCETVEFPAMTVATAIATVDYDGCLASESYR